MSLPAREHPSVDTGEEIDDPDRALLDGLVRGDRAAVGALARLYWPRIRRWAYLELHDAQLAEDAAQEALIRLLRFGHTYDPSRPFATWLRTLVRHAARDQRPVMRRVLDFFVRPSADVPPDRVVDLHRASERASSALAALTPRQRHLVDLCDRQGLSSREAAERLGIAAPTARVHLHRAHLHLAALLGDEILDVLKDDA